MPRKTWSVRTEVIVNLFLIFIVCDSCVSLKHHHCSDNEVVMVSERGSALHNLVMGGGGTGIYRYPKNLGFAVPFRTFGSF